MTTWSRETLRERSAASMLHGSRMEFDHVQRVAVMRGIPDYIRSHKVAAWSMAWGAEWARLAYPTLQLGHKYASALMCTNPPPDVEVRPPWPYYLIEMPTELVALVDGQGQQDAVRFVLCMYLGELWSFLALASFCELRQWQRDTVMMRSGKLGNEDLGVGALDIVDQDERASVCVSRLVLNTALALSDPTNVRKVGKGHAHKGPAHTSPATVYELGRAKPVRVDCRGAVHEYIVGGGRSNLPAVQWLVRGHWRNQPHGPARTERRMQWIEPYWKGADDAPLNVRPHVVKGA